MKTKELHKWDLSYAQARQVQTRLAGRVRHVPLGRRPRLVAGLDCSFSKADERIFAGVAVIRLPGFDLVESVSAVKKLTFPYIPGLLSFREAPVCLAAVRKLKLRPDLLIIDGQGIAHPRRLGLAAHLGLFLDKPTIGCAKSRLIGEFDPPAIEKGAHCPLTDEGDVVGAVVRTRAHVKPVFVSVGHRCTLENAVELTLACTTKYRLPEPTRLAHQLVAEAKARWHAG